MPVLPKLPPHIDHFLCQALAGRSHAQDWRRLAPQDWDDLQAAAQREGIAPLLYWAVKDQAEICSGMPPGWLENLRASYYAILAHNTLLFSTLWRILPNLKRQGLPVLLLKGASLAHVCYANLGLRPMGDLDMLFHQSDVQSAAQALIQAGLTPIAMEDEDHPENLSIYARTFVGAHAAEHVELHWNLFGKATHRYEPDLDWLWSHTQAYALPPSAAVEVGDVRVMQPSLAFLYLCAHLVVKHRGSGERLLWYMDLYQLQAQFSLDWDWIAQAAVRCHWSAGLHACLEKLAHDFSVELPPGYIDQVEHSIPPEDQRFLQMRSERRKAWQNLRKVLVPLRPQDRLKFLVRAVFPNPQYMRWRYHFSPQWLWPLAYPYRWLRAVHKLIFNAPDQR